MKILYYVNQFFAGRGGESGADSAVEYVDGAIGPGILAESLLNAQVVGTIVCGDNYFGENSERVLNEIARLASKIEFDVFIAGPAFQAGRYGFACGAACKKIAETFSKPAITSMHEENPGVDMYKGDVTIFRGGKSAADMKKDLGKIAEYLQKLMSGEPMGGAVELGYFTRGIRRQVLVEGGKTAARRGIEMLVKKIGSVPFESELIIAPKVPVTPAAPINDLKKAKIAIVTSGGIVPIDNPDKIQSASATRWGRYDISHISALEKGMFKTIHAGFDPAAADENPNRIVPMDVLRELEGEMFGSLHSFFYSTVGTGTTEREASRMANEMVPYLREDAVDAILLVST